LKIKIGWSAIEPDNTPSSLNAVQMRTPTAEW